MDLASLGWTPEFQAKALEAVSAYSVKILGALALLFVALFLAGRLKKLAMAAMRRSKVDDTLVLFTGHLVKWGVLIFAGVSILGIIGIQTASFAAVIAASGLAIGLAFQGSLSNIAAGVMLLVFRPFRVGQVITVSGQTGTVAELELFTTALDTPDKRRVILPNSAVFGATIENASHHETRRVDIVIGVSYDADLDETRALFQDILKKHELVHEEPAPQVVLSNLGASSVDWTLRAFAKTSDYWAVREQLLETCKKSLDKAEIGIPYPQVDVHFNVPNPLSALLANYAPKNGSGSHAPS